MAVAIERACRKVVVADARRVRASPEVKRAIVLLEDEIVAAAGKKRIVYHVAAAPVGDECGILHHIPAVFGVECALRRRLAAAGEEVALEEEVPHRACGIAYAAGAIECAVLDRAVPRDEKRANRKP